MSSAVTGWLAGWLRTAVLYVLRSGGPVPRHLGIIMDGNRRYAARARIGKQEGHQAGFDKLHETLFWLLDVGIRNVSVYAFSIDNFKRTKEEVDALMDLAQEKFEALLSDMELIHRYQVKVLVTGDLARVPTKVREAANALVRATEGHSKCVLNICFAYTGSYDIARAVDEVSAPVERSLLTEGLPPVDLLLRTSGEKRLSDFLLWQCGGAHLAFIDTLWPDLSLWDLARVILEYQDLR